MASYQIHIEGQVIPVPEEIGASDENVKRTLTPFWPEAANALITRTETDGVISINVVKKAGTKGASPLEYLEACPGGRNPAVEVYLEMETARVEEIEKVLELSGRIDAALEEGKKQNSAVIHAWERLERSRPVPASAVVLGF